VVIPDGTEPAIDRAFVELPGRPDIKAEYTPDSTKELYLYRARAGLTGYRPDGKVVLAVGDELSAIIAEASPELSVTSRAAQVTALDRKATLKLPRPLTPIQNFDRLVEVDRALPEGTPLFKEGKLAGLVLLGTRFLGASSGKSYVVSAERIEERCSRLNKGYGSSADNMPTAPAKALPATPR
jgi:hypothetical protein